MPTLQHKEKCRQDLNWTASEMGLIILVYNVQCIVETYYFLIEKFYIAFKLVCLHEIPITVKHCSISSDDLHARPYRTYYATYPEMCFSRYQLCSPSTKPEALS